MKQAHRSLFQAGVGRVWHTSCDPFTVRVLVETVARVKADA